MLVALRCVQPAAFQNHRHNAGHISPEHVAVSPLAWLRNTHLSPTALPNARITVLLVVVLTLIAAGCYTCRLATMKQNSQ